MNIGKLILAWPLAVALVVLPARTAVAQGQDQATGRDGCRVR